MINALKYKLVNEYILPIVMGLYNYPLTIFSVFTFTTDSPWVSILKILLSIFIDILLQFAILNTETIAQIYELVQFCQRWAHCKFERQSNEVLRRFSASPDITPFGNFNNKFLNKNLLIEKSFYVFCVSPGESRDIFANPRMFPSPSGVFQFIFLRTPLETTSGFQRFVLLHEIGHASRSSHYGIFFKYISNTKFVFVITMLVLLEFLHLSGSVYFVFTILIVLVIGVFQDREMEDVAEFEIEHGADRFACAALSPSEASQILNHKLLDRIFPADPNNRWIHIRKRMLIDMLSQVKERSETTQGLRFPFVQSIFERLPVTWYLLCLSNIVILQLAEHHMTANTGLGAIVIIGIVAFLWFVASLLIQTIGLSIAKNRLGIDGELNEVSPNQVPE